MSHINYPPEFAGMTELFKLLKEKHDADVLAGFSVLTLFLNEQSINLGNDDTDINAAIIANSKFSSKEKEEERLRERRDRLFNPIFEQHRGMVQFLKRLYKGNVHRLGDWGVTVDGESLVVYPFNIIERKNIVVNFINKHNSYPPGTSPLEPYIAQYNIDFPHAPIDLNNNFITAGDTENAHNNFVQAEKDKENFREQRDNKMAPVEEHILAIGQYLMGLFNKTPHSLGNWGFVIDDANPKVRERDYEITQEAAKTIHDVVLGSVVYNNGTVDVDIFPGKDIDGTPFTLSAGKTLIVKRGYGTMTTKNPSNTDIAILRVTVMK
jgi:hypothetical protein